MLDMPNIKIYTQAVKSLEYELRKLGLTLSQHPNRIRKVGRFSCSYSAQVAQSVEQWTENPCVDGSIPPLGTGNPLHKMCGCSSMVEHKPSKLDT